MTRLTGEVLTGLEIPIELKRLVGDPSKEHVFLVAYTSDPNHPGGMIFEGVKLDSMVTSFSQGRIKEIVASVMLDNQQIGITWTPEDREPNYKTYQFKELQVLWNQNHPRLKVRGEVLKDFFSRLPIRPTADFIDEQHRINCSLTRVGTSFHRPSHASST